jgi:hypothetical protein
LDIGLELLDLGIGFVLVEIQGVLLALDIESQNPELGGMNIPLVVYNLH